MLLEAAESSYFPAFTNMQQDVLAGNVTIKYTWNVKTEILLSEVLFHMQYFVRELTVVHIFTLQPWRRRRTSAPIWGPWSVCLRTWRAQSFLMSGVTLVLWCTQYAWCGQTPDTTTPQHASSFCCRRPATSSYSRSTAQSSLYQVAIRSQEPVLWVLFIVVALCC